MGRRDCLTKNKKKFTSSGAQRWAEREMGNTKKNTATLMSRLDFIRGPYHNICDKQLLTCVEVDIICCFADPGKVISTETESRSISLFRDLQEQHIDRNKS